MESLLQDLRYALRVLRRSPGFTALSVLTLGLAIGATTAIFSVVYGVLLRPLSYPEPDRIMAIHEVNTKGTWSRLADPNFDDFRDQNRSFQAIAKYSAGISSVAGGSQPTRSTVATVSPDFFHVFRVQPFLGRDLNAADVNKGAAPVALVSYGFWAHLIINRPLAAAPEGRQHSVFGDRRAPDGFSFPGDDTLAPADSTARIQPHLGNYSAAGRLRDGITVSRRGRHQRNCPAYWVTSHANNSIAEAAAVVPLQESLAAPARSALLILLGALAFLLLVACANVANLLLAQASARTRALAIRSALGATQGRLVRQYLTEAFLLSLAGGGLGVLAAFAGVAALLSLAPQNLPRLENVSIDVPVLVFALLLSAAVAVGLGAFTAIRATSMSVREGLGEGGREQAGSQGSQRVGRVIVAAQIAITLVLVVGAGLLGRSLMKVLEVNPGFRVEKIITMDVSLPWVQSDDAKAKAAQAIFFSNLIHRLRQIPGVHNVGATSGLPMDSGLPDGMFMLMTPEVAQDDGGVRAVLSAEGTIRHRGFWGCDR